MTTYRIYPASNGGSVAADSTGYCLGVEFYVTQAMQITGFWWWCAAGASTAAVDFELWQCNGGTSGSAVPGTAVTSGALTQGQWNATALSPPVDLTPNQHYRVAVRGGGSVNWYAAIPADFGSDIVNGPLVAPSVANAVNNAQGSFITSLVMAYPAFTNNGASYGVDVSVSDPASNVTAFALVAPVAAGSGPGTAGLTVEPGPAAATAVAHDASTHYPQTAVRRYVVGNEPYTRTFGQEPPNTIAGQSV